MAIYCFMVSIISRGSGRSAVGASAYRAGEKLHNERDGATHDYAKRNGAVGASAYRSGERLICGDIVHDYTRKRGIIHSEIMLPKHAPKEYQDRQTLSNAMEKAEKQHNARTAREIVVALPVELNGDQHIELMRSFVKENFVNAGMCADYSIHSGHKHARRGGVYPFEGLTVQKDNPHAHILLTVRPINEDGTWGAKSKKEYILDENGERIKLKSGEWKSRKVDTTDWDKQETLLKWRENWAKVVNERLERFGFAERIDHRTLEEQGIDREPTKHMGHEAWNLERKGIKTGRGNENRDIMRRNIEREKKNTAEYMRELKESHMILDKEIAKLNDEISKISGEIRLFKQAEDIIMRAEQIRGNQKRIDGLKSQKNADKHAIKQLEHKQEAAKKYFKQKFNIAFEQAEIEAKRLEERVQILERSKEKLQEKLTPYVEDKDIFITEFMRKISTLPEEEFQKILKDSTPKQATELMERRKSGNPHKQAEIEERKRVRRKIYERRRE